MEPNWTGVQPDAAADESGDRPDVPRQPEPHTRLVGVSTPAHAIEAFESVYRSSPDEFRTIAGVADLTPDARRTLASLLMLSASAREALVEVLRLPEDVRAVVTRVLELPPEVRETLRVFLAS